MVSAMKAQTIGVEIEFTGITRAVASKAIAEHFGITDERVNAEWLRLIDSKNREWKIESDSSIRSQKKCVNQRIIDAPSAYKCELITPILKWDDLETLKGVVNVIKAAGGFVNETCGLHVHIGAADFTAKGLRNLVNIVGTREEMFYQMFATHEWRKTYCRPTNRRIIGQFNEQKPKTVEDVKNIWYDGSTTRSGYHYDDSRYTICNLHAFFSKGTIEFRIFNGTLEADEVITAVHFTAAVVNFGKTISHTIYRRESEREFKSALKRATSFFNMIGLNGEEFKITRQHLLKNLRDNQQHRAVA